MKTYLKKPVKVQAIQLTWGMLQGSELPAEVWVHNGEFFTQSLEGTIRCGVGAWFIRGGNDDVWFIQDHIFKANYEEVDETPRTPKKPDGTECKHENDFWFDREMPMCYRCNGCGWSEEEIVEAGGTLYQPPSTPDSEDVNGQSQN